MGNYIWKENLVLISNKSEVKQNLFKYFVENFMYMYDYKQIFYMAININVILQE